MGKGGKGGVMGGWLARLARVAFTHVCFDLSFYLCFLCVRLSLSLLGGGNINSIYRLVRWFLDIFLFTCLSLSVDTSGSAFHVHCMFRALFAPSVYMCM